MKWEKKGFICSKDSFNLSWFRKNTMTPLPYALSNNVIRIYLTFCDEKNEGRVGFIDVDSSDPSQILNYSENPALDLGMKGAFDENGVLPTSLLEHEGKLYLYYSAYQKQISYPYAILSGLAVSVNGGSIFRRVSEVPLLERTNTEMFQRSAIEIMKFGNMYKMWYTSGLGWVHNGVKLAPKYDIKYMESPDFHNWYGCKAHTSVALKDDEYGLTMPQVFYNGDIYKMFYSIRSISKGYRLGYAESLNGISFERQDDKMEIDISPTGFDSEMLCFGKVFCTGARTYLFYCGNHYGMDGLGYAELVS